VVASEDNEGLQQELREAFRLYDKEVRLERKCLGENFMMKIL
jgi:hypothetical protein